jgi:hypothetical protein
MTQHASHAGWSLDQGLADLTLPAALLPTDAPQSYQWVGNRNGTGNGNWNTASDWNPNGVPGAADSVTFATGLSGYTVYGDATASAIAVVGDGVTFDGAITEADGGAQFFLTVAAGGQVTLDANSFVTGQELNLAPGTLLDVQGGLLTTGGFADVAIVEGLAAQMVVADLLALNQLYVQTGGSYTGNVGLDDNGSITIDTSSNFGGGSVTLFGSGSIYAAAAPGQDSGTVGIGDDIFTNVAGTYLNLGADPGVTLQIGAAISGGANVIVDGGTVELTGVDSYTGITQVIDGGTLQIDQPGAVASDLIFLDNGGFVNESNIGGTLVAPYQDVVVGAGGSDTVNAAGGGLLVFGGDASALRFVGGALGSTVIGGSGVLTATAGTGDLIFGGSSGADSLYAGAGNSTLVGGTGAHLYGTGTGDGVLIAGGNNVTADASQDSGSVTVFGAAGDAIEVLGGAGTVHAILNSSDATVYGGHGTMDVYTGSGSLSLDYVVGFGGGTTNVVGFDAARDVIALFAYAPGTAQQALASDTVSGGNTYLQLSDGTRIDLFGVTDLTLANFAVY